MAKDKNKNNSRKFEVKEAEPDSIIFRGGFQFSPISSSSLVKSKKENISNNFFLEKIKKKTRSERIKELVNILIKNGWRKKS